MKPLGTIGWIDLTVPEASKVRDFYTAVAGWTATEVPMGDYADYSMLPPGAEKAVAGICHARGKNVGLPPQWLIYIMVNDLDQRLERCQELGGTVVLGPKSVGSYGRFAVIRDPAGAVAGLFEPPPSS